MMENGIERGSPRSGRKIASLLFLGVGGQILAFLFVIALARFLFFDRWFLFTWFNLFSFYVYLPAYLILALALFAGRKVLAVPAAILVLVHLSLTLPSLVGGVAPETAVGESVRLFNANLLYTNEQTEPMIAEIEEANADILIFQEYTPDWHRALSESRIAAAYPYRLLNIIDTPFGSAIWSKRPLQEPEVWHVERMEMTRATVEIDGRPVRLYNLHPPPPLGDFEEWNRIHDGIEFEIAAESIPVVAIGDLNIGQHNRWYQDLKDIGLRNLHEELGRGTAVTWPNDLYRPPPVRLDHVFVTSELAGLSIREGIGAGSDHKPFVVDIALVSESTD